MEFNLNTDEEQKEESVPSRSFGIKSEREWICMKEETDKLLTEQIKNLISESLLGEDYQALANRQLNDEFNNLQIDHSWSSSWIDQKYKLFKDPEKTLMDRPKRTHLIYEQKLLIYRSHRYEERTPSQIWQKFGVSFPTVRRIIKQFGLNIRRQELYSKIRWRKNIDSHIVAEWISDFVREQTDDLIRSTYRDT